MTEMLFFLNVSVMWLLRAIEVPQNFPGELAPRQGRNKRLLVGGTSGHQSYLSPLN